MLFGSVPKSPIQGNAELLYPSALGSSWARWLHVPILRPKGISSLGPVAYRWVPQFSQNAKIQGRPLSAICSYVFGVPLISWNLDLGIWETTLNAVLDRIWQSVQWQIPILLGSISASYFKAPQWQPPSIFTSWIFHYDFCLADICHWRKLCWSLTNSAHEISLPEFTLKVRAKLSYSNFPNRCFGKLQGDSNAEIWIYVGHGECI